MPHKQYSAEVRKVVFTLRRKGVAPGKVARQVRKQFPDQYGDMTANMVNGLYSRIRNPQQSDAGSGNRVVPPITLPGPAWSVENIPGAVPA